MRKGIVMLTALIFGALLLGFGINSYIIANEESGVEEELLVDENNNLEKDSDSDLNIDVDIIEEDEKEIEETNEKIDELIEETKKQEENGESIEVNEVIQELNVTDHQNVVSNYDYSDDEIVNPDSIGNNGIKLVPNP